MTASQAKVFFDGLSTIEEKMAPRYERGQLKKHVLIIRSSDDRKLRLVPLLNIERDTECWTAIGQLFEKICSMEN